MRFAEPCVNRQAQMLGNFVNIAFFFDELFDQRLIRTSDDRRLARIPGIAQGKQKIDERFPVPTPASANMTFFSLNARSN